MRKFGGRTSRSSRSDPIGVNSVLRSSCSRAPLVAPSSLRCLILAAVPAFFFSETCLYFFSFALRGWGSRAFLYSFQRFWLFGPEGRQSCNMCARFLSVAGALFLRNKISLSRCLAFLSFFVRRFLLHLSLILLVFVPGQTAEAIAAEASSIKQEAAGVLGLFLSGKPRERLKARVVSRNLASRT